MDNVTYAAGTDETSGPSPNGTAPGVRPQFVDFHCHDRYDTFHDEYFTHDGSLSSYIDASLPTKQVALGVTHRGLAYQTENLEQRLTRLMDAKVSAGEREVHLITDCAPEVKKRSFEVALGLRDKYTGKLDIRVGAYPIMGFKEFDSGRERLLRECAKQAQFLVGLPERDDRRDHPVGFNGHVTRLIDIALECDIPEIQVHVDQTGIPTEGGLDRLIEAVRWKITNNGIPKDKRPKVWAVHCISSAAYDELRFWKQVDGLLENNIGIVCCPHAAISMRQRRDHVAPIHNLMARVLEYVYAGLDVAFGTDNGRDLLMPLPLDQLLMREYDLFASATRFYNMTVLDKLFGRVPLNQTDIDSVERVLQGNYQAWGWTLPNYRRV